jgi:hypothetical protein
MFSGKQISHQCYILRSGDFFLPYNSGSLLFDIPWIVLCSEKKQVFADLEKSVEESFNSSYDILGLCLTYIVPIPLYVL